ncbi:uncharacterized protein LOC122505885 [Leptopilina heterotoma]|uniref:uncharacterized protein LOC122505885 n=1 Tax=Leptopilina heterotoma TaxID=63436 RepID=UPI001CA9A355|nr:uncharacterized protein LOC122505885 [Leptopilina heterotoma]
MPEENTTICPSSFPSRKINKSNTKSSSCRCTFYSKSKEISSSRNNHIPGESSNSIEFEKSDKEIPRDSLVKKHQLKDNGNNLKNKKLSIDYQNGIGEKFLTQKEITTALENEAETLKLKEPSTKNIQQIDLSLEKLTEDNGGKSLDKNENTRKSHTNLKDTSIQTESKNCCENLREEIFNVLENLKEQSNVRQTVNSPPTRGFLSNTQTFGTGIHNPIDPNLESTFENRPFNANSPKVDDTKKNTYAYSNDSSGNFLHRLEEKKDCLCCGTELTLLTNEATKNSKNSQKLEKQKEKQKEKEEKNVRKEFVENNNSDDPQIVDASRPEFVDVLIEIGQCTRSLERQLAQMNEAMRSRINETNAWTYRNENTQPVGSSTPKEAKTDERIFLSLSNYMGSDIANFSIPEEESAFEEERVTNKAESNTIKELNRDNQLFTLSPIGTSTPVIEKNKVIISKKSTHDNGQVSNIHVTASKKIIHSNQIPGPSTNNHSSNLKNNMSTSKSSDISLSSFIDGENKNKKIQTDDFEETQYKDFPRSKRK